MTGGNSWRPSRAAGCLLMGWSGRAQGLILSGSGWEASARAQGACDAHQPDEDTGRHLDDRHRHAASAEIEALAEQDESCRPIISSAVVAAIGNGSAFKQWRNFGAWLGLVPRQESTGDRTILGKISKRGNKYVRTLFVQAAHVLLVKRPRAAMQGLMPWIDKA